MTTLVSVRFESGVHDEIQQPLRINHGTDQASASKDGYDNKEPNFRTPLVTTANKVCNRNYEFSASKKTTTPGHKNEYLDFLDYYTRPNKNEYLDYYTRPNIFGSEPCREPTSSYCSHFELKRNNSERPKYFTTWIPPKPDSSHHGLTAAFSEGHCR
ncbi:hypothetical protein L1987_58498 [Smallanthus sonchifolius]|uniref:Uncharacterized protein n=1 Tax=Smallanthus sonchifolius TaxID=185202 RepID=A0ACB9DFP7_9ASTR|nr:hypothetical protein L1987_58498 [Smallanthus sonchifolius]